MKKLISLMMILTLAAALFAGCGEKVESVKDNSKTETKTTTEMKDGTYEGIGQGKDGDIKVSVVIKDNKINKVNVAEQTETAGLGDTAIKNIVAQVEKQNNLDVDTVSGASLTSKGVLEAITNALVKAGASKEFLAQKSTDKGEKEEVKSEYSNDVVIIGGGGAGLSAAIEARESGASVVVVEKMPFVGGNTLISGGEMAAAGNWVQKKLGIEDSTERHLQDTLKGGDNKNDEALVRKLVENALPSAEWLRDDVNVTFDEDHLYQFGGHTAKRSLIPEGATGSELIKKLKAKADNIGVEFVLNTRVTDLVQKDDRVVGVIAKDKDNNVITFNANNAVIIAAGGFGANVELRKKYDPNLDERYLTTNHVGATGDGIALAEQVNADFVGMEYIQPYPACNPITGAISYVADTRFDGAVLVNIEGKRFVEELDRRDVISNAIVNQSDKYGYLVWDKTITDISKMADHQHEYDSLVEKGLIVKAETLEEAAKFFKMDEEQFMETIKRYNKFAEAGKDEDFNRRGAMTPLVEAPFYMQRVTPSVHHTMGGIKINVNAQVVNKDGEAVKGLYAAGEATGGIHGTNRLGSNAIADVIVFGRIAGENAAKDKQ